MAIEITPIPQAATHAGLPDVSVDQHHLQHVAQAAYDLATFALVGNGGTIGLLIDSVGAITTPAQPMVLARPNLQSNVTGGGTGHAVLFQEEIADRGGDFVGGTGIFTAPITGLYRISVCLDLTGCTDASSMILNVSASNRGFAHTMGDPTAQAAAGAMNVTVTQLVDMDASDTMNVILTGSGGTDIIDVTAVGVISIELVG